VSLVITPPKSANLASHRCICASTWLAKEPSIIREGRPVALPRFTRRPSDNSSTKSFFSCQQSDIPCVLEAALLQTSTFHV